MTAQPEPRYTPGMRIVVRDCEWRIDRVDTPDHGGKLLGCTGQSELVRGKPGQFLTLLDGEPDILAPETTQLLDDTSSGYTATRLYLDTLLQNAPPADDKIHLGHRAAMDLLPYQLDPALQALKQTRPRILIADTVGLGKTLSAGILATELIKRNRGKRILVLAVKSMLTQFQREMWQRFTLPLTRLDSVGLQRVRNTIPTNHNPFHYFDRAIISIDTLKQNLEYRQYLEQCRWDIVIIDEAHNVARRSSNSLRHKMAELLCTRCDAMILLSATPHDGKPESFASLIRMLDPTAIPDTTDYAQEDYQNKGLVIRRFKKDVAAQLKTALPERRVHRPEATASAPEDAAFSLLADATFQTLDTGGKGTGQLFRTTLEKALLSSPDACLSTLANRKKRLERKLEKQPDDAATRHDLDQLQALQSAVSAITPEHFSKLQHLINMLKPKGAHNIGWNPKDAEDRLVIFTESVVTLRCLMDALPRALKLKTDGKSRAVAELHGSLKDTEIADTVNAFNNPDSSLRLLICSDVASEGLNLHHCSHRLIHFDIPWSLLVFQQRNGRIDRYGQTQAPDIHYLTTATADTSRGDNRVLQILVDKDTAASQNLGDPSEFGTQEEQEHLTAAAMETPTVDLLAALDALSATAGDDLTAFTPDTPPSTDPDAATATPPALYPSCLAFTRDALGFIETQEPALQWREDGDVLDISQTPADLQALARRLPREAIPPDYRFLLTANAPTHMAAMHDARNRDDGHFGTSDYLWPQHPVVQWLRQRLTDTFGRHTAPVMRLPALQPDEHWFLLHGGFPNRRGQTLIQDHAAVAFKDDTVTDLLPLDHALSRLSINHKPLPNRGVPQDCDSLTLYLPDAVTHFRAHLKRNRDAVEAERREHITAEHKALDALRARHLAQLEADFSDNKQVQSLRERRRREREDQIARHFADYEAWLNDSVHTEDEPYIQVMAVITGDTGEAA